MPVVDMPVDETGREAPDEALVILDGHLLLLNRMREYWVVALIEQVLHQRQTFAGPGDGEARRTPKSPKGGHAGQGHAAGQGATPCPYQ